METNSLQELQEILACSVCLDTFKEPRELSCGHIFCRECIEKLFSFGIKICPICRKDFKESNENALVSQLSEYVKSHCVINEPEIHTDNSPKCSHHNRSTAKFFCYDCERMICRVCYVLAHPNHKMFNISDGNVDSINFKFNMEDMCREAQTAVKKHKETLTEIDSMFDLLKQCQRSLNAKIETIVKRRVEEIHKLSDELKSKVDEIIKRKNNILGIQKDMLLMEEGKLSALLNYKAKNIDNLDANTQDDIKKKKLLQIDFELEMRKVLQTNKEVARYQLEEDDSVMLNETTKLLDTETVFGVIDVHTTFASLCKIVQTDSEIKLAQVGKKSTFKILSYDRKGRKNTGGDVFKITIKKEGQEKACTNYQIEVIDKFDGSYIVSYTPQTSGKHLISVKLLENDILDSPFYCNVVCVRNYKVDNNSLFNLRIGHYGTKPREFKYPMGVACSDDGIIFVCDSYNHRIQCFDMGNVVTNFTLPSKNKLNEISTDINDYSQLPIILKQTTSKNPTSTFVNQSNKIVRDFTFPVTINNSSLNELLVISDTFDSKGRVRIFRYKIEHQKVFLSVLHEMTTFKAPCYTCFSVKLKILVVSDMNEKKVYIFNMDTFEKIFVISENNFCPGYVCINETEQTLCVSEFKNDQISIFDIGGKSKNFGSKSKTVKHFTDHTNSQKPISGPRGCVFDYEGNLIVNCHGIPGVLVLDKTLAFIKLYTGASLFSSLEDVSILINGLLLVSDAQNHRLQFF